MYLTQNSETHYGFCFLIHEGIACTKFWSQRTYLGIVVHMFRDDRTGQNGNLTTCSFTPPVTTRTPRFPSRRAFRSVLPVPFRLSRGESWFSCRSGH